jgi:AraC family transcriptional regulator, ethanolamine operon transcriptional activator
MENQNSALSEVPYTLIQLQSTDVDDQSVKLSHWEQTYEQLTPGAFSGSVTEAWFGCLQLIRETTNQSIHEAGKAWQGSSTFAVPLAMEGNAYFGNNKLCSGDALVLAGGDELDFRTPRQLDIVAVSLDTNFLSEYAEKVEHCAINKAGLTSTKILVSNPAQVEGFGQFLRTTLESVFTAPDLLRYPQLQKALEEAILGSVLSLIGNDDTAQKPANGCVSRYEVVKRAKEYLRLHVDESLTIGDLCRQLNVSRRTLQYSFQDVLDINPVAYIRAMRLNGVRRALKKANPQTDSVQDIAARWGFWHLSHFCTDYKFMFGELPSATLRH